MEKKNELALQEKRELTPSVWKMLTEIAPVMHTSRIFGVSSQEQATAIMLKGYELGLPVTASFEFINVIEGKPTLSPRGALALINAKGVLDAYTVNRILDHNGKFFGYECTMKRGKTSFTSRFTLEDAKRAQLTEGSPTNSGKRGYGNWEKYPENMAMWRAIGFCADVVCPDITGGMTTFLKAAEQFNVDVDDNGNFIDVKAVPVTVTQAPPIHTEPTLNDLLEKFTPEQIMEANNGNIPATQDEVNAVAKLLTDGE